MRQLLYLIFLLPLISALSIADTPQANGEIKLGFIAPLTGPFPDWGESVKRGVQIALLDTKNKFSVNYQDDACDPKQAVSVAQYLFSVEKVKYVLGPGCDDALLAIAPLAVRANAILLSTGLLAESVFIKHKNIINFATQISAEAKRLARQIEAQQIKRLVIVHGTNSFGQEYDLSLSQTLAKNGIETYSEATDLGTTDFRSIITRTLQKHPDGVFIHQGNMETLAFIRQFRNINKLTSIFSYYSIENDSFRNAGSVIEGLTYSYPLNSAESSERKKHFDSRFVEKFGTQAIPSASSYYVYDGVMLLDKAFDSCLPANPTCVLNYFKQVGKYQGISGEMTFRKDGGNERNYGIKRVVGGEFAWLSQIP